MNNKKIELGNEREFEEFKLEEDIRRLFKNKKFSIFEYAYISTWEDKESWDQSKRQYVHPKWRPKQYGNYHFLVENKLSNFLEDLKACGMQIPKENFSTLKELEFLLLSPTNFNFKFVLKVLNRFQNSEFIKNIRNNSNVDYFEKDKIEILKKIERIQQKVENFLSSQNNYEIRLFNKLIDWLNDLENSQYAEKLKQDPKWFSRLTSHMPVFHNALEVVINIFFETTKIATKKHGLKNLANEINEIYSQNKSDLKYPIFLLPIEFITWIAMHRNNESHVQKNKNLETSWDKEKTLIVLNQLKIVVYQIKEITNLVLALNLT